MLSYLALGAAQALPKIGLSIYQGIKAANLTPQDTTTPEQREALGIARQRAASNRLAGAGLLQGRLAQGQAAAIQQAQLGAGSASDFLAAAAAADRTRAGGEIQLGIQGEQANAQAQGELVRQLGLQAQQRQRDLQVFNNTKAALTQGSIENAANAVDTGAAYAAYGLSRPDPDTATAGYGLPVPNFGRGLRRSRYLGDYPTSRGYGGIGLPRYNFDTEDLA